MIGTVNASITGTPNVSVSNTPSQPVPNRDVDNPANEPFQGVLCSGAGLLSSQCTGIGFPGVIHVPTTTTPGTLVKRLVIEYVNGLCDEQAGSTVFFFTLQTTVNKNIATGQPGATQTYYSVPQFAAGNNHILGVSAPTHLYADPGTDIPLALGNGNDFGRLYRHGERASDYPAGVSRGACHYSPRLPRVTRGFVRRPTGTYVANRSTEEGSGAWKK